MIHAYFDDSSDPKRERYVAVGGLVGSEVQFLDLDIFWSSRTSSLTGPFRSTDCETQHGQFAAWSKPDCDALMKDLVAIIRRTDFLVFGSIIPAREFKAIFPASDEYDPYMLALRHAIINMAYAARNVSIKLPLQDVRIVCEDSTATSGKAYRVYNELKDFHGWRWWQALVGFSTGTKKLMALQAADLMAREAFKHADNFGIRPTRKPVKALQDRISFHLWTKETLAGC